MEGEGEKERDREKTMIAGGIGDINGSRNQSKAPREVNLERVKQCNA